MLKVEENSCIPVQYLILRFVCISCNHIRRQVEALVGQSKGAARGGAEGAQAPPLAIRILMFIS